MAVVNDLAEMSNHTIHIRPVGDRFTWVRRSTNYKDVKEAGQSFPTRYNAQRSAVHYNGDIWQENVWDHYPAGTKFRSTAKIVKTLNSKRDSVLMN